MDVKSNRFFIRHEHLGRGSVVPTGRPSTGSLGMSIGHRDGSDDGLASLQPVAVVGQEIGSAFEPFRFGHQRPAETDDLDVARTSDHHEISASSPTCQ